MNVFREYLLFEKLAMGIKLLENDVKSQELKKPALVCNSGLKFQKYIYLFFSHLAIFREFSVGGIASCGHFRNRPCSPRRLTGPEEAARWTCSGPVDLADPARPARGAHG